MVTGAQAVDALLAFDVALHRNASPTTPERILAMKAALEAHEAARPVDYAELLVKYMGHVVDCEGIDFVTAGAQHSDAGFTPEEWVELQRISEECRR